MTQSFSFCTDPETGEVYLKTPLHGKQLLTIPQLNKGTAFTEAERDQFQLRGKLPHRVENIEEQVARAYVQYQRFENDVSKNIYLRNLHSTNETLLYSLVSRHLDEMIPILYTPTVAEAVKTYSTEFREPRGLFISYPDRHRIKEMLSNRTNPDIDLIVATDAEGILGIGDWGIGGIEIPVAKLLVYTLCAGLNPSRYLPVFLDVGTNNPDLLDDPLYLGWRHKRINADEYEEMTHLFVSAVKELFPSVFLHWEDFGRDNARRVLQEYRHDICSFNDDMQGTAAVTVAALLSATRVANVDFKDQIVVVFGAGTAGTGIADEIVSVMMRNGLSKEEAYQRFYLIDRPGLLTTDMTDLTDAQKPYARNPSELTDWQRSAENGITLDEVVKQIKPTTLIGCSGVAGAFHEEMLKTLADEHEHPIIFPLSNPSARVEAHPKDILQWTQGRALIATGSPFGEVTFHDHTRTVAQCNNALVFPGIGLGVIATKAREVTDEMLWVACETLSTFSTATDPIAPLLPSLNEARNVSFAIAKAVGKQAIADGVAELPFGQTLENCIKCYIWDPHYYRYELA